jgi:hypothetical protein
MRPEEEGGLALSHGQFGLDVIALVGQLRFVEQRSMRAIHRSLRERGVDLAQRTVTDLVHCYAALLARPFDDPARLAHRLRMRDQVVLALTGVQPERGQPVLWVLRDVLSGTVFLARCLAQERVLDPGALVSEMAAALPVPITALLYTPPGDDQGPAGEV